MSELLTIILGAFIGVVAVLILIPLLTLAVAYGNWCYNKIVYMMEVREHEREEKEIEKFKKNL